MFREELAKLRQTAGLGQEQLGDRLTRLGWDQTYISKIKRDVRRVNVVELIAICKVVGVDPRIFVRRLRQRFGKN